jgi:hypothetical protein
LIIGIIVAIAIGTMLWVVIGPAVVLIGIPTPRTSEDNRWSFFQAYSWLSGPDADDTSVAEISSTYWLGSAISIIGLSILAAGVIGIILAFVPALMSKSKQS